jgi:hypothetical protein
VNRVSAKLRQESSFLFVHDVNSMLKGDIQFAYFLQDSKSARKKFPFLRVLDHSQALLEKDLVVFGTKTSYIIKKEYGFFDLDLSQNISFLEKITGKIKVEKIQNNRFKILSEGDETYQFQMDVYFDSDDISSSSKLKMANSINSIKKLDVAHQGGSSTLVRDFSQYSEYTHSGKQIHLFSPLNDHFTIVTTYSFYFVKKPYALQEVLLHYFFKEVKFQKEYFQDLK